MKEFGLLRSLEYIDYLELCLFLLRIVYCLLYMRVEWRELGFLVCTVL